MRKFAVLAMFVLLFSVASAQRNWIGVSTPGLLANGTGAVISFTPGFSLSLSGVVGFERLLGPLDLRAGGLWERAGVALACCWEPMCSIPSTRAIASTSAAVLT